MQLKFNVLVAFSVLTLVALIGIQGYLIYNTYELKKKTYTIDARNAIAKVYNSATVDSIMWLYRTDFLQNLQAFEKGNIKEQDLIVKLQQKTSEINPVFVQLFNEGLAKEKEKYDVKIKKVLTSVALTDSLGNTNQIYNAAKQDTIMLLGENFQNQDGLLINNSTWQDDQTPFKLNFQSSIFMNISDWDAIMLRELSGLLILSSLLFLFVVSLFYYSIRNLMKQKRVAKIKTDFINNITHELKTPLSTLSIATKTLTSEHTKGNTEMVDGAIQVIDRQNTRLQKLIDQVLQSSLGYQQIHLSKGTFNGSVFINELLDDYLLSINSSEIKVQRNIDSTGIALEADKFYLSTAIINLLNNAIKYGGTELTVSYGIDKTDSTHYISIKDNGIGISPKYQRFIFEKFYRVSEKDTHNYKGLGLGLYYTKQIIKAHGGSISVESEANKGSLFTIKIPII
ncbi:HAMP domain-containing sensor histidine kinase [Aequorivita todarodis]|uniref:sensor histidine kinase n=1 Tax=Aequorivita todarodis TaxID=2036821 RepID=UPI002350E61F|nr:HAMP domain-containing sensor histidine kinase [Aequorivita todarodis]MDC7999876.1 HAMP domain-containing sensor histidine kinase [Aequorivita todarodis]